jgi:flavin reductase (DIM6/NTAB) family NADH-FMN oxidoreductase RutF
MSLVKGLPPVQAASRALGSPALDGRALRAVFGRFATGITVVSAGREDPSGMTANSFTSVSIEPPLILVCVNRNASVHRAVLESGGFAVTVLSAGQERAARYFADHSRPRGAAEFGEFDTSPAPYSGAPILHGALAWFDCALATSHDGGDHAIFLGSVLASGYGPSDDALLFFGGRFHRPPLTSSVVRG